MGVVYNPEHRRFGNYFPSILRERNDAFIFVDETNELHPINIEFNGHQISETNPSAM